MICFPSDSTTKGLFQHCIILLHLNIVNITTMWKVSIFTSSFIFGEFSETTGYWIRVFTNFNFVFQCSTQMGYWKFMSPKYCLVIILHEYWDRLWVYNQTYTIAAHINVKNIKETAINASIVRYTKNHRIWNITNFLAI